MSGGKCERIMLILWNFVALYLVLSLCLLTWYSRLYTSWACVTDTEDILLMCQFTNQVPLSLSLSHSLSLSLSLSHTLTLSSPFSVHLSISPITHRYNATVVKRHIIVLIWISVLRETQIPTIVLLHSTPSLQR